MIRKATPLLLLLLIIILAPANARASVWGEENVTLIKLLLQSMEQTEKLRGVLTTTREISRATNEGLALAREVYREAKTLSTYTLEDFLEEAKEGLYEAFPELRDIEGDVRLINDQIEKREVFFSYYNRYDPKVRERLEKVMSWAYKSTIWPVVFPQSLHLKPNMTPVDQEILERYQRTGQLAQWAVRTTSMAAMAKSIKELYDEATKKKDSALLLAATQAELGHIQAGAMAEFTELYKQDIAMEEKSREMQQNARKSLKGAIDRQMEDLLKPDAMRSKPSPE